MSLEISISECFEDEGPLSLPRWKRNRHADNQTLRTVRPRANAASWCNGTHAGVRTEEHICARVIALKSARLAYLENLFRMRPLGVVSKKLMGDRKMAWAILSCNLRDACSPFTRVSHDPGPQMPAHRTRGKHASEMQQSKIGRGASAKLTSIEQKIHKIRVCRTTRADDPKPKAK